MRLSLTGLLALTLLCGAAAQSPTPTPNKPGSDYPIFETDKISNAEFAARRDAVRAKMAKGSVAVFFTNPERNRNNDCDFRFRPDSTFWYLSGCEEPDSALLLAPGGVTVNGRRVTEVLFVNDRDLGAETWTGYRMGPEGATPVLGVQAAVSNGQFGKVLESLGTAPVMTTAIPPDPAGTVATMIESYRKWQGARESVSGLMGVLGRMRAIKSKDEIRLMRHAAEASAAGHCAVLQMVRPNLREYALQATMEYHLTELGCEFPAYASIVGAGPNGCILHYENDRRVAKSGDLVCMDAAGEYHGYAADVTRTFPVNGHYTKEQRAIYDLVLEAQTAGIKVCRNGASMNAAHTAASAILREGMIRLGIIKEGRELGRYFMHGTSHTVGLDVHDTWVSKLEPGVVLTVEPGIYIKAGSPCDPKWWNIGVRIEDDILVTSGDPVILSAGAPRKAEDVERMIQSGLRAAAAH